MTDRTTWLTDDVRFSQVDVFCADGTDGAFRGNPVAVVHDADALSSQQMARFADWTHLSETSFLLRPTDPAADYRLRIFTPGVELPFAGHPTLGSAAAWLAAGGVGRGPGGALVQECGVGLVTLDRDEAGRLAFAAPPFQREEPVAAADLAAIEAALGVAPEQVRAARWIDNGPGWVGLVLDSVETVLALRPDPARMAGRDVGVLALHPPGAPYAAEVRAFAGAVGVDEDPVTGSLNAGFGVWLTRDGVLPPAYTARQGTALGRDGRVHVRRDGETVWVSGATAVRVSGSVDI